MLVPGCRGARFVRQPGEVSRPVCASLGHHRRDVLPVRLAASPYADNTSVLLFSDHGYLLGEKNTFQKQNLWERANKVPLIMAGPGIAPGVCAGPVSLIDIYPTVLALMGVAAPADLPPHARNLLQSAKSAPDTRMRITKGYCARERGSIIEVSQVLQ